MTLSESYLQSLVTHLNAPDVVGITYAGSFAQGDAGPYSDVDLQIYVRELPEQRYRLEMWNGYLVSIAYNTFQQERENLSHPQHAIWSLPELNQAVVLLDKDGSLASFKQAVQDFEWSPLQPKADAYAVEELAGFAEEVHKILNDLHANDESTVLTALAGLTLGLRRAIAVQRGLLIETENSYFEIVQNSFGRTSKWIRVFRPALDAASPCKPLRHSNPAVRRGLRNTARHSYFFKLLFRTIIAN